jgi:vesicular inhibitory amino acid transporter
MRHPYKWRKAIDITYLFTSSLDFCTMVLGVLMFGDGVLDGKRLNTIRMEEVLIEVLQK